jgi:trehalose 6-phosphate synthase/phosphatase
MDKEKVVFAVKDRAAVAAAAAAAVSEDEDEEEDGYDTDDHDEQHDDDLGAEPDDDDLEGDDDDDDDDEDDDDDDDEEDVVRPDESGPHRGPARRVPVPAATLAAAAAAASTTSPTGASGSSASRSAGQQQQQQQKKEQLVQQDQIHRAQQQQQVMQNQKMHKQNKRQQDRMSTQKQQQTQQQQQQAQQQQQLPPQQAQGRGTSAGRTRKNAKRPTEEEILEQIHKLHAQLESVRESQHADAAGDHQNHNNGNNINHNNGNNNINNNNNSNNPVDSGEASTAGEHGQSTPRLIVVSNRLPVTISKSDKGEWSFKVSSGGLVSALAGVKNQIPFIWVGWTGMEVASSDQEAMRQRFQNELSCYPVFLSDELAHNYYNGFCNDVLWPLFHYVPLPIMGSDGERKFDFKFWEAYSKANHRFAEAVMQVYQPGDLVWVQDYHLMLLPNLLRKRLRNVSIGFFLHTPFPSSEVYRVLPVRGLVLQGVLASDIIGFHTYDYARHFLSVCTRILGLEASPKGVNYKNRFVNVGVYPIGIDPSAFETALASDVVKEGIVNLSMKFHGKKVLLGVDRLDYIKGVPHKLMAFECLLARHPEWKGKVVLVQIAVPSRTEVEEYKKLITQTNELVGRINGKYSSVEYSPIVFINQSVNFNDLCSLYSLADVAIVSSIRDGMNLVSYEYVMCQQERHGVLVLSEFAGSAQSLSSAIRVNPWNIEELASALHEALSVPERERELKHGKLYRYVTKHTAAYWAQSFVADLQQVETIQHQDRHNKLPQALLRLSIDVLPEMRRRNNRLIILDYEGTLCAPAALPEMSVPSSATRRYLHRLSQDPRNSVYLLSGRSKDVLDRWFGDLNVGLVAEHGCDFRPPGMPSWEPLVGLHDPAWRDGVIPILQYFCERTPGSSLELKDKIITWHFRDADPTFGSWQAKELQLHLAESCMNLPVEVVSGPKYLELRPVGVTRVAAIQRIVAEFTDPKLDFVFAMGSDKGDQDVFSYLNTYVRDPEGVCITMCCHVGKTDITAADRYVPDVDTAFKVLKEMAPAASTPPVKKAAWNVGPAVSSNISSSAVTGNQESLAQGSSQSAVKRKDPLAAIRHVHRSASYDAIVGRSGIFNPGQANSSGRASSGEYSGDASFAGTRAQEASAAAGIVSPLASNVVEVQAVPDEKAEPGRRFGVSFSPYSGVTQNADSAPK